MSRDRSFFKVIPRRSVVEGELARVEQRPEDAGVALLRALSGDVLAEALEGRPIDLGKLCRKAPVIPDLMDAMDALVPVACMPVQISGRNLLWREIVLRAIHDDPDWHGRL